MATRYNNRKIILSEQTLQVPKLLPGMIVTFNYVGVLDPRPVLLFLHHEKEKDLIEGLNLNYINPAKIKKLFNVIDFKKGETGAENLIALKEDYFRVRITTPKFRTSMTNDKFYKDVVQNDNEFVLAYRSYKVASVNALKVTNIIEELIHDPGGDPNK